MLKLLEEFSEISISRKILMKEGLSHCRSSFVNRVAAKSWVPIEPRGHYMKSWDVWMCTRSIRERFGSLGHGFSCLDMGAYGSEIPHILIKEGNCNVSVVDLNDSILSRSHGFSKCENIYVGDMYDCALYEGKGFDLVTSISVFEHGYSLEKVVTSVSTILNPGGHLLMSVDYNSSKVDTSSTNLFGMTWNIFSYEDIIELIDRLSRAGIRLMYSRDNYHNLLLDNTKPIKWAGRDYTFLILGFVRG